MLCVQLEESERRRRRKSERWRSKYEVNYHLLIQLLLIK